MKFTSMHPESINANSFQEKRYKRAASFIILIIVSAFGPYMLPSLGLRLEHFVIYGFLGWVFLNMAFNFQQAIKIDRHIKWIFLVWIVIVSWVFVSTLFNALSDNMTIFKVLASLENFIQPLALILITSWLVSTLNIEQKYKLLELTCITTIALLCLNSLVCLMTIFSDTSWFLKSFHGAGDEIRGSVHMRAASMGRFSGIFNQPFEAGLAYSAGLLFWVYLAVSQIKIKFLGWISFILLLVGGALSVSKVFILGGAPLAMMLWVWFFIGQLKIRKSTILGWLKWSSISIILMSVTVHYWTGLNYFLRLFDITNYSKGKTIRLITAKRFGTEEGGLLPLFAQVWSESPIYGYGAHIEGALDNAFLEFFYYGGSVALFLYFIVLIIIMRVSFCKYSRIPYLSKFLLAIWMLVIGAGLGAPVLTINRSSIFIWIAITLVLSVIGSKKSLETSPANKIKTQGLNALYSPA